MCRVKAFFLWMALAGVAGCTTGPEKTPVDSFTGQFISYLVRDLPDSLMAMTDPDATSELYAAIAHAGQHIKNATVFNIRTLYYQSSTIPYVDRDIVFRESQKKLTSYFVSYEYSTSKGIFYFDVSIKEKDNRLFVYRFHEKFHAAPLFSREPFIFSGKPLVHYLFIFMGINITIFVLATFRKMLLERISIKKKIVWSLIILLVSFPGFVLDWNTGQMDSRLFSFAFLGTNLIPLALFGSSGSEFLTLTLSFTSRHLETLSQIGNEIVKSNIHPGWMVSIHVPLGAIVYLIWRRRKERKSENTGAMVSRQEDEPGDVFEKTYEQRYMPGETTEKCPEEPENEWTRIQNLLIENETRKLCESEIFELQENIYLADDGKFSKDFTINQVFQVDENRFISLIDRSGRDREEKDGTDPCEKQLLGVTVCGAEMASGYIEPQMGEIKGREENLSGITDIPIPDAISREITQFNGECMALVEKRSIYIRITRRASMDDVITLIKVMNHLYF